MMTRGVKNVDPTPLTSTSGSSSASLPAVVGAGRPLVSVHTRAAMPAVTRVRAGAQGGIHTVHFHARLPIPIREVRVGATVIAYSADREELFKQIYKLVKIKPRNDIWFNSEHELRTWLDNRGTTEGIGLWKGMWVNLVGKGPIVYAEERHDSDKYAFIEALNIKHYLVEAESERRLTGVDGVGDSDIYTGDEEGTGHALENFWVRSGMSMDNFWGEDTLKNSLETGWCPTASELAELKKLLRVVSGMPVSTPPLTPIEGAITKALGEAKRSLASAKECSLERIIATFEKHSQRGISPSKDLQEEICRLFYDKSYKDYSYEWGMYESQIGDRPTENPNVAAFDGHFSRFKQAIKEIGHLQFKANASPEESSDFLREDDRRIGALASASKGERPMEVRKLWEGRRELFMLRNIREALAKGKRPLLITMGADHAKNQRGKIEALVGSRNLVIGDITSLAALGTQP